MAIDESRWASRWRVPPLSVDDRVPRSRANLYLLHADNVEMFRQPRGTLCRVLGRLRLRADRGEADKGAQRALKVLSVAASIGESAAQRSRLAVSIRQADA